MTRPRPSKVSIAFGLASTLLSIGAFTVFGVNHGTGFLLGIAATAFNLWILWGVVQLTGRVAEARPPSFGSLLLMLAFVIKVPVFLAIGTVASSFEGSPPRGFLWGLGLVYCWLIGWAIART